MRAVSKARPTNIHELEIRIMDQGSCVQRIARFASQPLVGETAKPFVHQGEQLIEREGIPIAPSLEKTGDIRGRGRGGCPGGLV